MIPRITTPSWALPTGNEIAAAARSSRTSGFRNWATTIRPTSGRARRGWGREASRTATSARDSPSRRDRTSASTWSVGDDHAFTTACAPEELAPARSTLPSAVCEAVTDWRDVGEGRRTIPPGHSTTRSACSSGNGERVGPRVGGGDATSYAMGRGLRGARPCCAAGAGGDNVVRDAVGGSCVGNARGHLGGRVSGRGRRNPAASRRHPPGSVLHLHDGAREGGGRRVEATRPCVLGRAHLSCDGGGHDALDGRGQDGSCQRMHSAGGAPGRPTVRDVRGGARLDAVPVDVAQVQALRARLHMVAAHLDLGECPMMLAGIVGPASDS